jgi:hypothetical protein
MPLVLPKRIIKFMSNLSANTSSSARPQVFISYSHEPPENADFVRDLAGWLRQIGFIAWLDEERIPAAASIQSELKKAIEESDVGLFVVTSRWTKRDWTQHEVRLFAKRSNGRRLVVLREDVELGDLGPHLDGLKTVRWEPEDKELYEHYWEIYCGITNSVPGPKKDWAYKARNLTGGSQDSDAAPIADSFNNTDLKNTDLKNNLHSGRRRSLPCTGRPVKYVEGKNWTFFITDNEEWIGISADGEFYPPLPRLGDHAAATFSANQDLLVGMYEPMMVRLREKHWEYLLQEAPILCFTNHKGSDIAGTAAGGIVLLNDSPMTILRIRDPVIALDSFKEGIAVLGSRGILGYLSYPISPENTLKWINSDDFGRVIGLFKSVDYSEVGVYSSTSIGLADPLKGRINSCAHIFRDGIRDVIFLGARSKPYAVLTDTGGLFFVDAGLGSTHYIHPISKEFVSGCCPGSRGEIYAWTSKGRLYAIAIDGRIKELANDNVAFAYPPQGLTGMLHIVRYSLETGANIEQIRLG